MVLGRSLALWMGAVTLLGAPPARAFYYTFPSPVPVVEFYNSHLRHFFVTASSAEIAALEAGQAGPGWLPTGFGFTAYPPGWESQGYPPPVFRFFRPPAEGVTPSHFFTADPSEAAALRQPGSGWIAEHANFGATRPAAGSCGTLSPIFRLYNDRGALGDGSHRYVADAAERDRMVSLGWVSEGVGFCAGPPLSFALRRITLAFDENPRILPVAECLAVPGACLGLENLPTPTHRLPAGNSAQSPFTLKTGAWTNVAIGLSPDPAAALENLFVQPATTAVGFQIDTRDRGTAAYSRVDAIFKLDTRLADGRDPRFFPWSRDYASEVELGLSGGAGVKSVQVRDEGSHAYGVAMIEFVDRRSGRSVLFAILAYGTIPPQGEFLGTDVRSGKVIVGTAFRRDSRYGRSDNTALYTPPGYAVDSIRATAGGGYRMTRPEFQRVIDAARTLDAALSEEPADYYVDNFRFANEVLGEAVVGLHLRQMTLELWRR